jgi:alanine dehydrogenase
MRVGVPREVQDGEYRVALTPAGARELVRDGHEVLVERDAGAGSAIPDADFRAAGARIAPAPADVWSDGDLILKVKEPAEPEYGRLRAGQVLFAYLHLAASRAATDALLRSGITAIAYETVRRPDGSMPLLAPMSEVAGRMAPQVGAQHLQRDQGGSGRLLGGVPGVRPAKVVVLGAGVSGLNAAAIAAGLQAEVLILDRSISRLRQADAIGRTLASSTYAIERHVRDADLVIGAVLIPGARAPTLVTSETVGQMRPGSVLVDLAIDQGGCFADSRPTTHAAPTYRVHGTTFYCVANMPAAVPRTSTYALSNATLPYVRHIAGHGWQQALRTDPDLARGLNTTAGQLACAPVGQAHGLPVRPLADLIG